FVEDKDRRVFQKNPGNRNPLALTARQLYAPFAHSRIVPYAAFRILKTDDELMRISSLGCFNCAFNSRIRPTIENVVEHRPIKKRSVLRHQTDRCAQTFLRHSCDILTVNVDVTFLYVVEPQQ